MIHNFFTFASDDKSVQYLQQIFGDMNGIIVNPDASSSATVGSIASLSVMFKTFNSVILAVAVVVILYTTVVGAMKTAGEGEFMGKNWQSLWVPIRTVLGIAALVPFGTGYSAIQMIMMWVIMQGIGAADTLWTTVLNYVDVVGSPYAQVDLPNTGVTQTLSDLFRGLTCDAAARVSNPAPGTNSASGGYFCNQSMEGNKQSNSWCTSTPVFDANQTSLQLGPNGACGTLNYCNQNALCTAGNENSLQCLSCQAQVASLGSIISTLGGIAQQLVNVDYAYRDFYANSGVKKGDWQFVYSFCSAQSTPVPQNKCCVPPVLSSYMGVASQCEGSGFPQPDASKTDPTGPSDGAVKNIYWPYALEPSIGQGDFISTAVGYYMDKVQGALTTYIADRGADKLKGDLKAAQTPGWIYAGAYYYTVSRTNSNNLNQALPTFSMTINTDMSNTDMKWYRNDMDAATTLSNAAANAAAQASGGYTSSAGALSALANMKGMGDVSKALGSTAESTSKVFAQTVTPSGSNPLSAIQTAGAALLLVATVLYPAMLVASAVLGFLSISVFGLGNGVVSPEGTIAILVYFFLAPAVMALLGLLVSLGGMLAVYVPLIPFVIFSFGAIFWLITTIEAMVAGPLVALGILNPYGQHELLGSAAGALMLLFNIFLRPCLMIFGLVAAMLLASVVVAMISYTFWSIVMPTGIFNGASGMGGPLQMYILLSAYVAMLVAALNKCFSAISYIPATVIRWLGGHPEHAGEEEAVRATKEATERAAHEIQGGAKAVEAGAEKAKALKEKEFEAKKKGGPSVGGTP